MNYTINKDQAVAVATDYFWIPIDTAPMGVKLQLLTLGGVATHGILYKDQGLYTHWTPLPRKQPVVEC